MTEGAVAVRMLICHTYDGTPIAMLDLSDLYTDSITNVVLDEARQLAYAVSYYAVIDVVTMNVTARFNFTSEFNPDDETGASSMAYTGHWPVG
jgi:hypothetical protein